MSFKSIAINHTWPGEIHRKGVKIAEQKGFKNFQSYVFHVVFAAIEKHETEAEAKRQAYNLP